jgi:hypothetical protein
VSYSRASHSPSEWSGDSWGHLDRGRGCTGLLGASKRGSGGMAQGGAVEGV